MYTQTIKVKLVCSKYLAIFTKTDSGYSVACPELPYLHVTAKTLAEAETVIDETVRNYVRKGDDMAADYKTVVEVDKLWKSVIDPAITEISRKASKNGWAFDSFLNKKGFNQINRFNRSCSIRTTGLDEKVRKLTIAWRAGSDSFSYGNSLALSGWKSIEHSRLRLDSLVDDLADRLLA